MPIILPIKELRNASKLSDIDQAIYESEQEIACGAEVLEADAVLKELEKKHFGYIKTEPVKTGSVKVFKT